MDLTPNEPIQKCIYKQCVKGWCCMMCGHNNNLRSDRDCTGPAPTEEQEMTAVRQCCGGRMPMPERKTRK